MKQKVEVFDLEDRIQKAKYEALMNNERVHICRDVFQYTKMGLAKITVWYHEDEED